MLANLRTLGAFALAVVSMTGYATAEFNRLLSDDTFEYKYDDAWNVTRRTMLVYDTYTGYAWDRRDRLTRGDRVHGR